MSEHKLALLRQLLAAGQIDQAQFGLLAGAPPAARAQGGGAAAEVLGGGAAAAGERPQAAATGGVVVGEDNHGPIHTGDHIELHTHHHAAPVAPGASPAALRRAYLQWVLQRTDTLALVSGGDAQRPVRLGRVYTALLTTLPQAADDSGGDLSSRRLAWFNIDPRGRDAPRLGALAALDHWPRLVLLGGPGSGKSSLVQFVAHCLAAEALGAQPDGPGLALLTRPLPVDAEQAPQDKPEPPRPQPWRHGPLLPVLVVLRDLAAQLPRDGSPVGAQQVLDYLRHTLQPCALGPWLPHLEAELRGSGGLVCFDGLDEVPEAERRRQQIQQVVSDFAAAFGHCRILVTSRTYAYQEQHWKLPGFDEAPLADFNRAQIGAFVQAWYGHMVELLRTTPADADLRAAMLLRQFDHNPRIRDLGERPLLLTLLARLQAAGGGDLPEHREALYHEAVKLLLDDWEGAKPRTGAGGQPLLEPSLSEWLKAGREDVRRELNRLAFHAHRDQKDQQGTADIREADLIDALLRASRDPDAKPKRLQEYLRDRAGILVEHGVGLLQFPHRSFQEYLAACHLVNDDYPDQIARLAQAEPGRWREVLLLAAAHAARGNRSLPTWALVETLCPQDLPPQPSPALAWGALLAGQVLVASGQHLPEPAPRDAPKRERVRQAQVRLLGLPGTTLPLAERARAGRQLAALGDPRPEVMTLAGMQFCWVPPGPFMMGSTDVDIEKPVHRVEMPGGYFIGRFPVTQAQWRELLQRSGMRSGDADSLRGDDNAPVVWASWHEARAACAHLTTLFAEHLPPGWSVQIPSEKQWEKAARGGLVRPASAVVVGWDGLRAIVAGREVQGRRNAGPTRRYPWGDAFDADACNSFESRAGQACTPGVCPTGDSPVGCADMAGNVWEWTRTVGGKDWSLDLRYPYPGEGPADPPKADEMNRLVRGGAFLNDRDGSRCAFRDHFHPDSLGGFLGFRVVLSAPPVSGS
jgi:formylglycine-generating enzyme required for sulfatase activity